MLAFKIYFHLISFLKIIIYKIIYGRRFSYGCHLTFRRGFTLLIDKKAKVHIGGNCFFNNYCSIVSLGSIYIGNGTLFGEGVKIYDHNHIYINKSENIKNQGYSVKSISIGSHCWIGSNVVILKGVNIGDNCVIGAGCIVYKNVSSNTVVVNDQTLREKNIP